MCLRTFVCVASLIFFGAFAMAEEKGGTVLSPTGEERATFAGGCFWCLEPAFDLIDGVTSTIVGYTGGTKANPTYQEVSKGTTGHVEAIEVTFDPKRVNYERLLKEFWETIDPTQADGQFADRGAEYQTAIFFHSEAQRRAAEKSKEDLVKRGVFSKPIVTKILPASLFYPAEEYHQEYYKKNPGHYGAYKEGSGRAPFLRKMWPEKFD